MQEVTDNQISEIAEASGSTGSSAVGSTPESTGSSTVPVEPVQALDVPTFEENGVIPVAPMSEQEKENLENGSWVKNTYHEKKWEYAELKKILPARMKKKISKCFIAISKPARFTTAAVLEAEQFFEKEFPKRSPWAVYQKAMEMKREGKTRIVLL